VHTQGSIITHKGDNYVLMEVLFDMTNWRNKIENQKNSAILSVVVVVEVVGVDVVAVVVVVVVVVVVEVVVVIVVVVVVVLAICTSPLKCCCGSAESINSGVVSVLRALLSDVNSIETQRFPQ